MTFAPTYQLSWKGQTSGPFKAEEIRTMLNRGEISLMHQVYAKGRWMPLEEFFSVEDERKQAAQEQQRHAHEAEQKRIDDQRRAEHQAENSRRLKQLEEEVKRTQQQANNPIGSRRVTGLPSHSSPERTSGLAIAALIMGLLNFVPGPNLISWILAIIFGHVALSQMSKDPTLGGRGMAVAGLCITYGLIAIGLLVGIVIGLLGTHRF